MSCLLSQISTAVLRLCVVGTAHQSSHWYFSPAIHRQQYERTQPRACSTPEQQSKHQLTTDYDIKAAFSISILFILVYLLSRAESFTKMATQSLSVSVTFRSSIVIQYRVCWPYCVQWVVSRLHLSMLMSRFVIRLSYTVGFILTINWQLYRLEMYIYYIFETCCVHLVGGELAFTFTVGSYIGH